MVTAPPPALPDFRDRRTGLTVIGALTILLGGLVAMMVPLMVFGQAMAPASGGSQSAILPAVAMYGGLAAALIWLGIGSLFARRWARALLLILGWSGLVLGIVMVPATVLMLPDAMRAGQPAGSPPLPTGVLQGVLVFTVLVLGFFFIVIPGIWVLFYGSRHVKSTCEARNSHPSWTDTCPLPVLALSLWLAAAIPSMLLTPLFYRAVLPFFGVFLSGGAGAVSYLVLAAVWAVAAWWIYRLDSRGWWLTLFAIVVFAASNFLTYSRQDISTLYELMGLPPAQIEQMGKMPILSGAGMKWMTSAMLIPFLVYLLAIRRYFRSVR